MAPINGPQLGMDAVQMAEARASIAFVVTPAITLRDEHEKLCMKTFGIHKSEVLIMNET